MALAKGVKLLKISNAKSASQYSFTQWKNQPYYFATCVNQSGKAVFYQSRDNGDTWSLVESVDHAVSTAARGAVGAAQITGGENGKVVIVDLDVGFKSAIYNYPPATANIGGLPVPVPEVGQFAISFGGSGDVFKDGNPSNTRNGNRAGRIGGSLGLIYLWGDQRGNLNWVNTNVIFQIVPVFWASYGWYDGTNFHTNLGANFGLFNAKTGQMTGWINGGAGTTGAAPNGFWFTGDSTSLKTLYQSGEDQQPRLWRSIYDTEWEDAGGGGCATGPFDMSGAAGQRSCAYGWVAGSEAVAGVDPGGTFYVSLRDNLTGDWRRKVVCSIGGAVIDYVWMPYSLGHLVLGFVGSVPGQGYGLYVIIDKNPLEDFRRVSVSGDELSPIKNIKTSVSVRDRRADTW